MLGKLNPNDLRDCVLNIINKRRKEVLVGADLGEDCAVFELKDQILITSDPITGTSKHLGSLAINISANDIASSGGEPVLAMLTVIATPETPKEEIKEIMIQAETVASKLNIEIAGGHTEFSDAVSKTICSVTMVGVAKKAINARSMKVGDSVLMTKSIGLESTLIYVNEKETELTDVLTKEEINLAKSYLDLISVVKECKVLSKLETTSMHDVTEGGIKGALIEIFDKNELGANIDVEKISISNVTRKICDHFNVSPYKEISSGCLIFTTPEPLIAIKELGKVGISACVIGQVDKSGELVWKDGNNVEIISADTFDN